MSNVNYLIPKKKHPTFIPGLEPVGVMPAAMVEVPLLGYVTAGLPVDLNEDRETVSIPANMMRKNTYALKVRGDSMIEEQIRDGDVIIVQKRETAANGESVVAMINGEQVTLKKFYVEADGIRLQPANSDMEPIYLRNEEVQILGIVTGILRMSDN
ncbi:MAG: transcriptional repressor LexA [Gammaproteobacteria bacterium]|nr:transcriptional repressor LexA [Gammaproteobacteria bacterium]